MAERIKISECKEGKQIILFENPRTQENAAKACHNVNARLAVLDGNAGFTWLIEFQETFNSYIGLFTDQNNGNPRKFEYEPEEDTSFTDGVRGRFPWAENEPNMDIEGDVCVFINQGLLFATECETILPALCDRVCTPTASPTVNPTVSPTLCLTRASSTRASSTCNSQTWS